MSLTSNRSLRLLGVLWVVVLLGSLGTSPTSAEEPTLLDTSTFTKFVDPLPIPLAAKPTSMMKKQPMYTITARQFTQMLGSQMPGPTTVWGYDDNSLREGVPSYPGPTIVATRGKPVYVDWVNALPQDGLSPGEMLMGDPTETRGAMSPHLHGAEVPAESDGGPSKWFNPGSSQTYRYPNVQQAATLWYHDHALGITRVNVYNGLAGGYVVHDANETALGLPSGKFDLPLIIQDRSFLPNGELYYPQEWEPEFFGNTALVNGKIWPSFKAEPRRYRFRLLNGSQARFYKLTLYRSDAAGNLLLDPDGNPILGPAFQQIATDGGLLEHPVTIPQDLVIGPGEREEVVLDFTGTKGQFFVLRNFAETPFSDEDADDPDGGDPPVPEIMQFKVTKTLTAKDTSVVPSALNTIAPLDPETADETRDLDLREVLDPETGDPVRVVINGAGFHEPDVAQPKLGDTEVWQFINQTVDVHPMHVHLVQFLVLDRQPFATNEEGHAVDADGNEISSDPADPVTADQLVFTGDRVPPAANETGWKDTVRTPPGTVTRVIMHFGSFTGSYVVHCHILEHEENDMMRQFTVLPN